MKPRKLKQPFVMMGVLLLTTAVLLGLSASVGTYGRMTDLVSQQTKDDNTPAAGEAEEDIK